LPSILILGFVPAFYFFPAPQRPKQSQAILERYFDNTHAQYYITSYHFVSAFGVLYSVSDTFCNLLNSVSGTFYSTFYKYRPKIRKKDQRRVVNPPLFAA
jgi:hypothetical protein